MGQYLVSTILLIEKAWLGKFYVCSISFRNPFIPDGGTASIHLNIYQAMKKAKVKYVKLEVFSSEFGAIRSLDKGIFLGINAELLD